MTRQIAGPPADLSGNPGCRAPIRSRMASIGAAGRHATESHGPAPELEASRDQTYSHWARHEGVRRPRQPATRIGDRRAMASDGKRKRLAANGKRQTANGRRPAANGRRQTANRWWNGGNGRRRTATAGGNGRPQAANAGGKRRQTAGGRSAGGKWQASGGGKRRQAAASGGKRRALSPTARALARVRTSVTDGRTSDDGGGAEAGVERVALGDRCGALAQFGAL